MAIKCCNNLFIRKTKKSDGEFLSRWLSDEETLRGFPLAKGEGLPNEIDHATNYWIDYCDYESSLTACFDRIPCGIATLFIEPYGKVAHHSELGMLVDRPFRCRGIGTQLLLELTKMAKEQFRMEFLHLLVYADNPAVSLYKKLGFHEYCKHHRWIKEENGNYLACLFMEKILNE